MEINKEEYLNWRDHPVTIHFFEKLTELREEYISRLSLGHVTDPKQQDISLGVVGGLTQVIHHSFED